MSEREEKASSSQNLFLVKGTFPHRSAAQKRIYGKFLESKEASRVLNIVHFYSATGFFIKLIDFGDSIVLDYLSVEPSVFELRDLPDPPDFIGEDFEGFAIGGLEDVSYAGYLFNPVVFVYQDFDAGTTINYTMNISRRDIVAQGAVNYIDPLDHQGEDFEDITNIDYTPTYYVGRFTPLQVKYA